MEYILLIGLGFLSRIIPHPANFTLVGGMAVWLGSRKSNKWEILVPLLSMFLADFFLGWDSFLMRAVVYTSMGIMYLLGRVWGGKNLLAASFFGSLAFFVITNLGVWATSSLYGKSLLGLSQCFYLALPFWRNALAADLAFPWLFKWGAGWIGSGSKFIIKDIGNI